MFFLLPFFKGRPGGVKKAYGFRNFVHWLKLSGFFAYAPFLFSPLSPNLGMEPFAKCRKNKLFISLNYES